MKNIAFFDLDHTITTKDTMVEFMKFTHGKFSYFLNLLLLSPVLILYKLKIIPNHKAKRIMVSRFYKGWSEEKLRYWGNLFAREEIPSMLSEEAMQRILWHQNELHEIVIVTASMDIWTEEWARQHHFKLISTRMEFVDNVFTGEFMTPNCHGQEKEIRIKNQYDLKDFNTIYAYGDSPADQYMLNLANERFYRSFH